MNGRICPFSGIEFHKMAVEMGVEFITGEKKTGKRNTTTRRKRHRIFLTCPSIRIDQQEGRTTPCIHQPYQNNLPTRPIHRHGNPTGTTDRHRHAMITETISKILVFCISSGAISLQEIIERKSTPRKYPCPQPSGSDPPARLPPRQSGSRPPTSYGRVWP